MKKIIFFLLFSFSAISISLAQESGTPPAKDSSQVEFYGSMEDFLTKNIIPSVHITILAVTDVYRIFGGTIDFKVENFSGKKEVEDSLEEPSLIVL
jgi:hypothetical protein